MSESRRLRIRHTTGFTYHGQSADSYNEVRMTPPDLARQRVLSRSLRVRPAAVQSTYRDYFGTIVTTFDLHEPHDRLEVIAEAEVETVVLPPPPEGALMGDLAAASVRDRLVEYLTPTELTTLDGEALATLAPPREGETVESVARRVVESVRERVAYQRGTTAVTSTAAEVWRLRAGVCQDLSHVTVAALRALGVPARYVSGYLQPEADAPVGETHLGESHAWVDYFAGTWRGVDPTSGGPIGAGHVVVARGRDYHDVAPLKGVYRGDPSSTIGVSVEFTRLA